MSFDRGLSFESPDVEKEFPGLYSSRGDRDLSEEDERAPKKKELGKKKEYKKEKKDKGYKMFEEEDSEEEQLVFTDDIRSPSKMKKHRGPSFKLAKKEKLFRPKDKSKDKEEKLGKIKAGKEKRASQSLDTVKVKVKTDPTSEKIAFGVPLSVAVERSKCHDGILLPAIFRACIDYIEEFGLSCEGIYRISGVKSKVHALKEAYNTGQEVFLHEYEPNVVASLLKLYLREIPEPVLTPQLMPKFEQASTLKNVKQKVESFQQLIDQLPTPNRLLLSWMIVHMTHVIAHESQNKMSLQNVSIVLSPSMQISHRVLNVLFTHSKILFRDTVIKRYVPPLRPTTSHWMLALPADQLAIQEELKKQESLLNQLHEDLNLTGGDAVKEDKIWEVTRAVTALKRQLKQCKKAIEQAQQMEAQAHPVPPGGAKKPAEKPLPAAEPKGPDDQQTNAAEAPDQENRQAAALSAQVNAADVQPTKEEHLYDTVAPAESPVKFEMGGETLDIEETTESAKLEADVKETEAKPATEEKVAEVKLEPTAPKPVEASTQEETEEVLTPNVETAAQEQPFPVAESEVEKLTQAVGEVTISAPMPKVTTVEIVDHNGHRPEDGEERASSEDLTEDDDTADFEDDEELQDLLLQHTALLLEEEELLAIGDELRTKIETEQSEIERLDQEIKEIKSIRSDSEDSDPASSSDESEDEESLFETLQQLQKNNRLVELENAALVEKIHQERQICLGVKVQIRMIQRHQAEAGTERELICLS